MMYVCTADCIGECRAWNICSLPRGRWHGGVKWSEVVQSGTAVWGDAESSIAVSQGQGPGFPRSSPLSSLHPNQKYPIMLVGLAVINCPGCEGVCRLCVCTWCSVMDSPPMCGILHFCPVFPALDLEEAFTEDEWITRHTYIVCADHVDLCQEQKWFDSF